MRISLNYPIHLAAETIKGGVRPVLQHILVQTAGEPDKNGVQRGIAVAANGYLLAIVPVELDEGDVPGLVSATTWETAFKEHRKLPRQSRELPVTMLLKEETVTLPFQRMELPRCHDQENYGKVKFDTTFVDFARIVPERTPAGEEIRGPWSLNPAQLLTLHNVLGAQTEHNKDLVLTRNRAAGEPLLVEVVAPQAGSGTEAGGKPNAPYAVLMPVPLPNWAKNG